MRPTLLDFIIAVVVFSLVLIAAGYVETDLLPTARPCTDNSCTIGGSR